METASISNGLVCIMGIIGFLFVSAVGLYAFCRSAANGEAISEDAVAAHEREARERMRAVENQ